MALSMIAIFCACEYAGGILSITDAIHSSPSLYSIALEEYATSFKELSTSALGQISQNSINLFLCSGVKSSGDTVIKLSNPLYSSKSRSNSNSICPPYFVGI